MIAITVMRIAIISYIVTSIVYDCLLRHHKHYNYCSYYL